MIPYDRSETSSHCQRVCALALRMAEILKLGKDVRDALGVAASIHQYCGPQFREGDFVGIFQDLPCLTAAKPASDEVLRIAEQILVRLLHSRVSQSEIRVAAEILDACDLLDEAVEYAVFEGLTPTEAITRFHEEVADGFPPGLREALRQATLSTPMSIQRTTLPVMPRAAAKLMRTSDDTSPRELEQIASLDPVLAARLLEVANSARFGPEQPIMRLAEAAARVGVPLARKILFEACFGKLFASRTLQNLWRKSQMVAVLASEAARLAGEDEEVAYAAGLLHDIGRIVFEAAGPSAHARVEEWIERGFPPVYAEALTWSTDHASTGAELLRGWGLPEIIVAAVENHHQPERTGSPLASMLFLAEQWYAEKSEGKERPDLFQHMRRINAARMLGIASQYPEASDDEFAILAPAG